MHLCPRADKQYLGQKCINISFDNLVGYPGRFKGLLLRDMPPKMCCIIGMSLFSFPFLTNKTSCSLFPSLSSPPASLPQTKNQSPPQSASPLWLSPSGFRAVHGLPRRRRHLVPQLLRGDVPHLSAASREDGAVCMKHVDTHTTPRPKGCVLEMRGAWILKENVVLCCFLVGELWKTWSVLDSSGLFWVWRWEIGWRAKLEKEI